jgi:hypothetical protein
MKVIRLILLSILFFPTAVYGGQIYGTLTVDNKPVGRGVPVFIVCGATNGKDGETDDYGSYKVFAPKGKCTLKVKYGGQEILVAVYSYDDPVRYDFSIVRAGDGSYSLQRR